MKQDDLFTEPNQNKDAAQMAQFFTPDWAATELYDTFFEHLTPSDLLLEPTCGDGALLSAVPPQIPAIGVEIDPGLAAIARARSSRQIIVGDFCDVTLPDGITAVFGNPPFQSKIINRILDRVHTFLPEGGQCGFILPAYSIQSASTIVRWSDKWSLRQEALPRDMFPAGRIAGEYGEETGKSLSKPLIFMLYTKDREKRLIGLRLYKETNSIKELPQNTQRLLVHCPHGARNTWKQAVRNALHELGGKARLEAIYDCLSNRRPTTNQWWKEKIRQVCQTYFTKTADATYALA